MYSGFSAVVFSILGNGIYIIISAVGGFRPCAGAVTTSQSGSIRREMWNGGYDDSLLWLQSVRYI